MYPYYYGYRTEADTQLIADIAKAINGESNAIVCYEKLAGLAPNEEERRRILEIRQEEMGHVQTFKQIYTSLTGTQATVQLGECPNEYRKGLDSSFHDEQNTVDFYLKVSDEAQQPFIKETFRRAAADEQNHAVWFLYFITRHLMSKK